jgi:hypothetical protein
MKPDNDFGVWLLVSCSVWLRGWLRHPSAIRELCLRPAQGGGSPLQKAPAIMIGHPVPRAYG